VNSLDYRRCCNFAIVPTPSQSTISTAHTNVHDTNIEHHPTSCLDVDEFALAMYLCGLAAGTAAAAAVNGTGIPAKLSVGMVPPSKRALMSA
jgi:hypothetical protein